MRLPRINTNWIAAGILLGAFVISAVRYYLISGSTSDLSEDGGSVIRVSHWQLEPGFREALQWAIDEYNDLPHVKQSGIQVVQMPITGKVYNQFMNVHLISGTAPDIAVQGGRIAEGNALAKFYAPLGTYTSEPNPYNSSAYQVDDLDPALAEFLEQAPWSETFFDGLHGGYNMLLGDYYGIPVCTFGGARIFYNLSILAEVKAFARGQVEHAPQASWLKALWRDESNPEGYLPECEGIAWLAHDAIPQTLGELIFYSYAVQAYAESSGHSYLVPIAASNYSLNDLASAYQILFFSQFWEKASMEMGLPPSNLEYLAAYQRGDWDFDDPALKSYFEIAALLSQFYPYGFLGLDREQAQRRFVLGQAAMIYTGAWDAPGIFSGAKYRDNPEDVFEIKVAPPPTPAPGERWAEYITMRRSEANSKGAVPFAINKSTPHFEECLDFLKFISSHRINEGMSTRSGWLPVIVGAQAPDNVAAFTPIVEGMPARLSMNLSNAGVPPIIRNAWTANYKLYISGDISYEELAKRIDTVLNNPRYGIEHAWTTILQQEIDQSRANTRTISVERLNALLGSDEAAQRERAITYYNLLKDEGVQIRHWWQKDNPDVPLSEY